MTHCILSVKDSVYKQATQSKSDSKIKSVYQQPRGKINQNFWWIFS